MLKKGKLALKETADTCQQASAYLGRVQKLCIIPGDKNELIIKSCPKKLSDHTFINNWVETPKEQSIFTTISTIFLSTIYYLHNTPLPWLPHSCITQSSGSQTGISSAVPSETVKGFNRIARGSHRLFDLLFVNLYHCWYLLQYIFNPQGDSDSKIL